MDSFAVSLMSGAVLRPFRWTKILKIALFLALFQGGMPLIGWWLGAGFLPYIQSYDHWVAFGLLLILGGKMVIEGWPRKKAESLYTFDPSGTRALVGLSVATSIDALAVGISFAALDMEMCMPAVIITLTTFAFSLAGQFIGYRFGRRLQSGAGVLGGIILMLIGLKILVEHCLS